MPPSATAARTGMMTSRSSRERTLQFFSALREPGLGGFVARLSPCVPLTPCWPLAEVGAGSFEDMPPDATRSFTVACFPVRADACCSEASAAVAVRVLLLLDHTALAPFILGPLGTR